MSEKPILIRLQVKPERTLLVINPPERYLDKIGDLPAGAHLTQEIQPSFIIQVFIRNQPELVAALERYSPLVLPGGMLWLTYPKLTSKLRGDINRDSINAYAQQNGWTGIAMISIDDDWSALRLKRL